MSRKIAAIREQMHNILANQVLKTGDTIFVENMTLKLYKWAGSENE